jgi:hypothetical protein
MDKTKNRQTRTGGSISWEEREAMIKEYLTGNYTKVELWQKYTGHTEEHGELLRWMRALGYISNEKSDERNNKYIIWRQQAAYTLNKEKHDKDPVALERRINELEKQLETAQLKAEGYALMIEIAEKELKIPIRKKSGTK